MKKIEIITAEEISDQIAGKQMEYVEGRHGIIHAKTPRASLSRKIALAGLAALAVAAPIYSATGADIDHQDVGQDLQPYNTPDSTIALPDTAVTLQCEVRAIKDSLMS